MALKKILLAVLVLSPAIALGVVGCGSSDRSSGSPASTLGEPPAGEVPTVTAGSLSDDIVGETVQIEGEVVKQCPAVGCWFIVKDQTGEVFVDLNPAELRLKAQREGQHAQVTGRVAKQAGQFRLEARSVRFDSGEKPDDPDQKEQDQEP